MCGKREGAWRPQWKWCVQISSTCAFRFPTFVVFYYVCVPLQALSLLTPHRIFPLKIKNKNVTEWNRFGIGSVILIFRIHEINFLIQFYYIFIV